MNVTMKRTIYLFAILATGVVQAEDAFYKTIHYRADDPFVFCTQGMDIPAPCWKPMAPFTGQYYLTGACNPPNKYGRQWTQQDHEALDQLVEICPHARESGKWNGAGDGSTSPFKH